MTSIHSFNSIFLARSDLLSGYYITHLDIQAACNMNEDQRHINQIWRTVLISFGIILIVLGFVIGGAFNIMIMSILGIVLIIGGCCLWVKDKNRFSLWALWGLIPPIGFIILGLLEDRSGEAEEEAAGVEIDIEKE